MSNCRKKTSAGENCGCPDGKGWEQVTAVYGILFAGAAYLPIDIHNPQERIEKILHDSRTEVILTQQDAENQMGWMKNGKQFQSAG